MRLSWLWPAIITLSALTANLASLIIPGTIVGTVIIIWFLVVCPGMILVRALNLKDPAIEWTLAIALSLTIDAIVAGVLLYAGRWSPTNTLDILVGLSLGGAIVQLISMPLTGATIVKWRDTLLSGRFALLFATLLMLLLSINIALALRPYGLFSAFRSGTSTPVTVRGIIPHSSLKATAVPTPTLSPTIPLAGTYNGTIYNIAVSRTTNMFLTGIQRGSISGNFTGLSLNAPFKGSIDATKHIHFIVTNTAGQAVLSFDGIMRADGNLAGNYCGLDQQGRCGSQYGYGLWIVAPTQ